jgi:hypothetical protein
MSVDDCKMQMLLSATVLRVRPAEVMPVARRGTRLRPLLLAAIGAAALTIGILVYLADRVAGYAAWVPHLAVFDGRHRFGRLGLWLPSLVHPLAFSLFTAAMLQPGALAQWGACAFWGLVNVGFEVAQLPAFKPYLTEALQGRAGDWAATRALLNYCLQGTFDPFDVCAALLGALAAGVILSFVDRLPGTPHAPK